MLEFLQGEIRTYWKAHARATVREAQTKYRRLSDCVVVLTPGEGAPRLVKRDEAPERLKARGFHESLFMLFTEREDPDSLGLLWKDENGPRATQLAVARGGKEGPPAEPTGIPPFTRPLKFDDAWVSGVATMIWGLQKQACDTLERVGDRPSAFMIFWRLFEGSPTVIVREDAKRTLGDHKQWKEILGHIYTPCEDMMALVEISGRGIARFVRPGME